MIVNTRIISITDWGFLSLNHLPFGLSAEGSEKMEEIERTLRMMGEGT